MSLFDLPDPIPAPVDIPAPTQEYSVVIKQTKYGRDIMVCTAPAAPDEVVTEAKTKGLPLFTGREIMRMTNCAPEAVEEIIKVKMAFPGCTVDQILSGAIPA